LSGNAEEHEVKIVRKTHLARWSDALGHMVLADISAVTISEALRGWKDTPNKRGELRQGPTLNRHLTSLSCVFSAAVRDWGWTPKNPVQDVRRFKEPRGRTRYLSDDERTRLLQACKESWCPFLYLVVVLALTTGMRKAEIMNLRWGTVDVQAGVILLFKTKNNQPRRVAVRGLALDLLR
jgi:integrase